MSYMNAIRIRIPAELERQLKEFCKQRNRSTSDVVREAARRYLASERLHQLRERLRPHAEAGGFLTDEDVFKVVS